MYERKADDAGDETRDISPDQGSLADVNDEMQGESYESAEPEPMKECDVRKICCKADCDQDDQFLIYGSDKTGGGDTVVDL